MKVNSDKTIREIYNEIINYLTCGRVLERIKILYLNLSTMIFIAEGAS